ncbi:ribonuclease domain-containing protein [Catellatospora tritici]|uniref:ribonuclease domain-containing protein n=1 Tax=Catellatospora tritici TaxID=2851566 RepID=UPI001C2DE448|nr:ribonuclease domain-containing protein [Catellatospora tritici]MBV1853838.1 ribonuclease N [Catellatospora tritici]
MTLALRNPARLSWPLRAALVLAMLLTALVVPATSEPASAAVYSSCTISRCADARTARSGWSAKGFPTSAGWYSWSGGLYNYTGGQFYNREGQLPAGATYYEYDVYPRTKGAARDAYRIVVNRSTGVTWFSPNHYTDFYRL